MSCGVCSVSCGVCSVSCVVCRVEATGSALSPLCASCTEHAPPPYLLGYTLSPVPHCIGNRGYESDFGGIAALFTDLLYLRRLLDEFLNAAEQEKAVCPTLSLSPPLALPPLVGGHFNF